MINLRLLKLSDHWIWISAGALVIIGLMAIFSSTSEGLQFVYRQLGSLLVAMVGLIIFSWFDYSHFKKWAWYIYGGMLLMLLLVLFVGGGSAARWIQIAGFSFQPSEISKIIIIICLAAYLSDQHKLEKVWDNLFLAGMVAAPFLLIFKQPDLGTALVFIAILAGMLLSSWASPKLLVLLLMPLVSIILRPLIVLWIIYLLAIVLALFLSRASTWDWSLILGANIGVGVALPFIWNMLKSYQRQRIISFLNPSLDPYGAGYHSLQSKIAIGSGGLFGKGFLHGTQTQLSFIPEQHSDFIFSAIGEEFGFLGAMLVIILFFIIIIRAFILAQESRDRFGELLSAGIGFMMLFHVFANVGMTLSLLPVVGIPLPLVSFGGSSLLMNAIAIGILQNISMRRQKIIF
jgi:rod shape determining protein RodA